MTRASGRVGVGIVGAGVISDEYLANLTSYPDVQVVHVADLDETKAADRARAHAIASSGGLLGLLDRDDVEIVVNLTVPSAHVEVTRAALRAGKHVWVEKPLATTLEAGRELLDEARERGLRVAGAPDSFLGAGAQSALHTLRSGALGTPLSAFGCTQGPGPELWHPNPAFLYARGAGPLFDMGPYYIAALVQVFGPVSQVSARASTSRDVRVVGSGPQAGGTFAVEVPTYVVGTLDFRRGGFAHVVFSFDSPVRRTGVLEVNAEGGTVVMPDPNTYDGTHAVWAAHDPQQPQHVVRDATAGQGRGLGVLDLARSLRADRPERASGELALHVLDVLSALADSAHQRAVRPVTSHAVESEPLPAGWDPMEATL